jgi:hypothetical protein
MMGMLYLHDNTAASQQHDERLGGRAEGYSTEIASLALPVPS